MLLRGGAGRGIKFPDGLVFLAVLLFDGILCAFSTMDYILILTLSYI